jgi:hypothetical protein
MIYNITKPMKQILLFILSVYSMTQANAQLIKFNVEGYSIGMQGSFTQTTFSIDEPTKYIMAQRVRDDGNGFSAGAVFNASFKKSYGAQIEINYATREVHMEGGGSPAYTYSGDQTMEYIQVPLLFNYKYKRLFVLAGPQFGYLLSAKIKNGSLALRNHNNKNDFSKIDIGLSGGGGLKIWSGLGAQFRYTYGVRNINKSTHEYKRGEYYNRTLEAGIFYLFENLGGKKN